MPEKLIKKHCRLSSENSDLLTMAMQRLSLSARAYGKILKVSRQLQILRTLNRSKEITY